ncbi:MAG: tetratricopeptide repeat protein [Nitrosomonadales bacterium]
MSIIDEALKKLGNQPSPEVARPFPQKQAPADSMPDLRFVVGKQKRRPVSLLMAVAMVGAGFIIYLLLPKEIPRTAQKISTESGVAGISPPLVLVQKEAASSVTAVQPTKQVLAKAPAKISPVAAVIEPATPAPVWYEAGWKAAQSGQWPNAFAQWEDGVRSLPKDRMVIVSYSYADMGQFTEALDNHAKLFPAIGVRQHLGGQMLYRVIVFPYGGGTRQVLPKVQSLFANASVVNASRIQVHLSESPPATLTRIAKPASIAELPAANAKLVAESKLPPEEKPSIEKAETINKIATEQPAATNADDWESRSATVRDLLKAEDYPAVSNNAQGLTRDFPDRWEGWFWMGTAQLAQGQMDAADSALEHAGKLNPKVAQIWVQRAIVAQERGDHAMAVRLLNEARELSPKSPANISEFGLFE